jgi:hypothetical protein
LYRYCGKKGCANFLNCAQRSLQELKTTIKTFRHVVRNDDLWICKYRY